MIELPLDLDTLPLISIEDVYELPNQSGVYIIRSLYRNTGILYIGKAKNLFSRFRWGHHKTEALSTYKKVHLNYLITPHISKIELALIHFYNPPLNIPCKRS